MNTGGFEKLTAAEAALHYGQECVFISSEGKENKDVINWNTLAAINHCNIKLLLRPLSDITDEEAIEIAKITNVFPLEHDLNVNRSSDAIYVNYDKGLCLITFEFDILNGLICSYKPGEDVEQIGFFETSKIMRFLLSKGFDLYNLIKQGKALDKTKLAE